MRELEPTSLISGWYFIHETGGGIRIFNQKGICLTLELDGTSVFVSGDHKLSISKGDNQNMIIS
jgi:hypothetical protein